MKKSTQFHDLPGLNGLRHRSRRIEEPAGNRHRRALRPPQPQRRGRFPARRHPLGGKPRDRVLERDCSPAESREVTPRPALRIGAEFRRILRPGRPGSCLPRMEQHPPDSPLASYGRPPHASDDPHPPSPAALSHEYDAAFAVTADYQASLPDLMSPEHADDGHISAPISRWASRAFGCRCATPRRTGTRASPWKHA